MKKRGISPIIATVLLIAIVIVIAIILFLWFMNMSQEAITKFEGTNIELVCEDIDFNAEFHSGNLDISNYGNVPIFSIKLKIYQTGGHETKDLKEDYSSYWPSTGLNQGETVLIPLGIVITNIEEIVLNPVLIGVSESGKKTYVCDKDQQGVSIQF